MSSGCQTDCGPDDVYRLRAFETTQSIPRFNNVGDPDHRPAPAEPVRLRHHRQRLLLGHERVADRALPFSLPAKNTLVLNTATVVPSGAGAITIANDGRYGDLTGKTVALEPSTGFSFDSPMVPRVN